MRNETRTVVFRMTLAKPVPKASRRGAIFGERAGGPNAAQPVTQTMSTPYLRLGTGNGKHVAEKPHKTQGRIAALSSG
jgi:hypothetical protein